MDIKPINENTLMIYAGQEINLETADKVAAIYQFLQHGVDRYWIKDIVPSYTSILVSINLLEVDLYHFIDLLQQTLTTNELSQNSKEALLIEIPVYYGKEAGLDMQEISDYCQLNESEIIEKHTQQIYRVYAIGFMPGFAFLGMTDPAIEIPRKKTPRLKIPAGSVGLADRQTAVYPKESPGGWQIIGRTAMTLVDFSLANLTVFQVGAQVKFHAVSREAFLQSGGSL